MKLTKPFLSLLAIHQCNASKEVGKGGWLEDFEIGPWGVIATVVGAVGYAYAAETNYEQSLTYKLPFLLMKKCAKLS